MNRAVQNEPTRNTVVRINRRAHTRYALVRRPALLHSGARSEPCLIRNISAGGLMLRIYKPIAAEGFLEVELDSGQRLTGSVAWANKWEIGIAFAEPIDVDAALRAPTLPQSLHNRRALPRTIISCPAQLRLRTRVLKGRINDISELGARVTTLRTLEPEARGVLTLPDLPPMTALVRWSNGTSAGLQFDEPIPAEVLAEWLHTRQP